MIKCAYFQPVKPKTPNPMSESHGYNISSINVSKEVQVMELI